MARLATIRGADEEVHEKERHGDLGRFQRHNQTATATEDNGQVVEAIGRRRIADGVSSGRHHPPVVAGEFGENRPMPPSFSPATTDRRHEPIAAGRK
uniref:Uncharacterized protein n=1 Tax=Plectus sambesii TaxID=2011161 RepID=A0A914WET1_9BILA